MQDYLEKMQRRAEELRNSIETAEKKRFPEGRLRISKSSRQVRYYHVLPGEDSGGTYITKKKRDIVKKLAQKEYTKRFLTSAKKELLRLEHSIRLLSDADADATYSLLREERKKYVEPYVMTDELYAACWQAEEFEANPYMPEAKIFETRKGEMVRSKSEAILADMLLELGIPYHYEKALSLKNKMIRYPDFTLLKIKSREEIYLEHFGMLDDEDYRNGCMIKLHEYMKSGIYPGTNLLITFESAGIPLDIGATRRMLKAVFAEDSGIR